MGRAKVRGRQGTPTEGDSSGATPRPRAGEGLAVDTQVDDSLPSLGPPSLRRFGRYVVLGELGRGGMGMVLRGYDEQLERPVAIKVLHEYLGSRPIARLRREARVMAKLSHPNVVQVYEVGEHEGQTFVAMEMVKGQTVQTWMEQRPRPGWKACVELFLQLGEGLVAAHRRGLVHRDFKPGNAVVDEDGRARVLDFGLARGEGEQTGDASGPEDDHDDALATGGLSGLTRTGAVIGTPAYMSLEQANGLEADARSDQFSFCVSLYEALYGERPYEGDTPNNLMVAIKRGVVRGAPSSSDVPVPLRKVLLRGLAPEPDKRWPSMEALLDELRRLVAPRRRRALLAMVGVGLVAVGGGLAVRPTLEWLGRCSGAREQLAGVWDDAQRQAVESALLSTGLAYAPNTWSRVGSQLDAYADGWVAEHTEACEATRMREEQSEEEMSLRMGCLRERRQHLQATVGELARADATVVENAVVAVTNLPGVARCRDMAALRVEVPPPEDPAVAQQVTALDARLVEAVAKQEAGKYEGGLQLVDDVVRAGEALGYEPLMARAWLRQGALRNRNGDYEGSVKALRRAYGAAVANAMRAEAAAAASGLVSLLGGRLARYEEARGWAEHAEPLSRLDGTDLARASYFQSLGDTAYPQAKYEEARDSFERARALGEKALGSEHPSVADSLNSLASVEFSQGRYEQAQGLYERVLAVKEKALGPDHPSLGGVLQNLGSVMTLQGKHAEARELLEKALGISEAALGPDHPDVALVLHNLGGVTSTLKHFDESRRLLERSLAIREKALGPDHPDVAQSLTGLGIVVRKLGAYEDARALHERALAIKEKTLGPDHPDVAFSLSRLGILAKAQNAPEDAYDFHARAVKVQQRALGPDHPALVPMLNTVGEALIDLGRVVDALAPFERALSIGIAHEADVSVDALATARFDLAYALWEVPEAQGRDRPRARALAEKARDGFASLGDAGRASLGIVDSWLSTHTLP